MKRQIETKLIEWKNKKTRKPLLLQGARQVGKTYVLQDFAKNQFDNSHYFDLEELKTDLSSIFNDSPLDPKQLIDKLSFVSGKSINIKKDILILDEIQAIPRAITALKYFSQHMSDLAVAAAGSNLGVAHGDEPFPVGKVEILHMYPMNFEEFLSGTGEEMALSSLNNFKGEKTDDIYHRRLFDLLKKYFVTGGMPEVICQYMEKKDDPLEAFRAVRQLQKQLLLHYESDFSKYAGSTNSRHIERIFRAIPLQLSNTQDKKSKKFKFKDIVSKGYRSYEDLADPIDWLIKAGLALRVNTNLHPSTPVMAGAKENSFKLFMFDVGLLGAIINLNPETIMRYDYGSYKGYFAENFVLQELYSYGLNKIVTWSGRTSEIEFVLEINGNIIPVEVKAGFNTKAKSLQAFINKYSPVCSVKFTGNKFGCDKQKRIFNYPLYMISKFPGLSIESTLYT
ncbi:MAG: ATP-binding protein [Deltaproteobacteria bacterium]|nr:ATP-binding protein [Deltaproteobacteria bacterium]